MIRGRRVVQNRSVAYQMRRFFRRLDNRTRSDPRAVARLYGEHLYGRPGRRKAIAREKKLLRSRFYVGLSTGSDSQGFAQLTKRAALIADTLLLSHDWTVQYKHVGNVSDTMQPPQDIRLNGSWAEIQRTTYGMHCPSLTELGSWILEAELLLKAGLAWYLPSYSQVTEDATEPQPEGISEQTGAIDYLIRDGRAIDASGAEPIKSQLVHLVLQVDLPFIEGSSLRDFSKITIDEFDSYSAFRDFLRQRFLEMDVALNSVQSDRELVKLGLHIKDEVRAMRAEMERVRRKRAAVAAGAAIGSVGAILVAVYGPALEAAIAAIGASGGAWGIIQAMTDNSLRHLREDRWYYVWALAKECDTQAI